jgi:plasmid stabilization system protein ParE
VRFVLSAEAQQDIERITAFWAKQRPKNPELFQQQLEEALNLIEVAPKLAANYTSTRTGKTYFKWPLLRTRDVIYYEYVEEQSVVAIVTIQSPVAGEPPP